MKTKYWTSLTLTACIAIGITVFNEAVAETAYAWADRPTVNSYKPRSLYAFNKTGSVQIQRQSTGRYSVVFNNFGSSLPDNPGNGGHVQVSSYGSADRCNILSWNFRAPDFTVTISCFKGGTANTPVDTRFTVMATYAGLTMTSIPMMVGTADLDALQAEISNLQRLFDNLAERVGNLESP